MQLLFYTPGLAVGVYLSMFLCNRWPRQTFWPILLGSIIEAVGLGLMAWAIDGGKNATIFGMMALTGAGTALRFLPGPLHCIGFFPGNISSVSPSRRYRVRGLLLKAPSQIIALLSVAHPFGGSLGLTIMSTVFNNLAGESKELLPLLRTQGAPADVLAPHVFVAKRAVVWAFVAIMPFMILVRSRRSGDPLPHAVR